MKAPLFFCFVVCLGWDCSFAEVTISEQEDRIRIEIDGRLFTEWCHQDWKAPYLYPVIGPNGENITRHFPMKDHVPHEQQDHPHHRSIRFSHRNVNGMSFWSPDSRQGGHDARIELERIESITSGKTGELIFWNRWNGDEALVLREKVRLVITPIENQQVILDYDLELHAGEIPVTFHDEKDGGLAVRVAGTMKVEDRSTKTGNGTIQNSRGDRNGDAWGKRAEWADYSGPDASGKIVGVAIFDHPSNLRFPTHWHARTYGLLTANRFGIGYFEAKNGAEKGAGDFTIKPGGVLKLRHRLYFHHGDSEMAEVARYYQSYASESP